MRQLRCVPLWQISRQRTPRDGEARPANRSISEEEPWVVLLSGCAAGGKFKQGAAST